MIAILVIVFGVFVALAIINAFLPDYTEQIMIDRLSELENKTEHLKDVVMELARQKGIEVTIPSFLQLFFFTKIVESLPRFEC